MRVKWTLLACVALSLGVGLFLANRPRARAEDKEEKTGPALVHNVFFSLKDSSDASKKKFIASCKKHLTKHPGEVYFAVGPIVADLKRPVNDTAFDVCLTVVFKNKAAHDTYQDAKRHLEFIEESKASWTKVRVFDSYVD